MFENFVRMSEYDYYVRPVTKVRHLLPWFYCRQEGGKRRRVPAGPAGETIPRVSGTASRRAGCIPVSGQRNFRSIVPEERKIRPGIPAGSDERWFRLPLPHSPQRGHKRRDGAAAVRRRRQGQRQRRRRLRVSSTWKSPPLKDGVGMPVRHSRWVCFLPCPYFTAEMFPYLYHFVTVLLMFAVHLRKLPRQFASRAGAAAGRSCRHCPKISWKSASRCSAGCCSMIRLYRLFILY